MASEAQLPNAGVAFDDAGTRDAWERTRRAVRTRLWLWSGLFVAALVAGFVLSALTASADKPLSSAGPALIVLALFLYLGALYACRGALSRLRQARQVLEAFPWQRLASVRRHTGEREPTGVVVQFSFTSHTMTARDPRRWYRWDPQLERGAWFAGDHHLGGVLARPGGSNPMIVQARMAVLSSERRTPRRDHQRLLAAAQRS